MKKIFSINVPGRHGYSFGVSCDSSYDEDSVIDLAYDNGLFQDEEDADYAFAEDITDFEYSRNGLAGCTYEL